MIGAKIQLNNDKMEFKERIYRSDKCCSHKLNNYKSTHIVNYDQLGTDI